ncbi:MAG TPA: hypothetical protein PKD86_12270 [Gemmatales bacterium]|nr:hypothetical protein [Gemmatales bacterium]HMP60118.1 hypothetical protein [Gemmatales bacterium]
MLAWLRTLVLVLGLLAVAVPAATAAPPGPLRVAPLLTANWWTEVKVWFSNQAGNRARVIQFGLVGMCLALAILYTAGKKRR